MALFRVELLSLTYITLLNILSPILLLKSLLWSWDRIGVVNVGQSWGKWTVDQFLGAQWIITPAKSSCSQPGCKYERPGTIDCKVHSVYSSLLGGSYVAHGHRWDSGKMVEEVFASVAKWILCGCFIFPVYKILLDNYSLAYRPPYLSPSLLFSFL